MRILGNALKLLDLESLHELFGDLIQSASSCIPSSSNGSARSISSSVTGASQGIGTSGTNSDTYSSVSSSNLVKSVLDSKEGQMGKSSVTVTRDDSYVKKGKVSMYPDGIAGNSLTRALPTIPARKPIALASSGK